MTSQQKNTVKEKICAEMDRVSKDIAALEEITQPVGTEDMDEITRMNSIVSKSVNEAALSSARKKFAGLEYALKRIDDPEFGFCMDCGERIAFARLLAMPESALCIDCAH